MKNYLLYESPHMDTDNNDLAQVIENIILFKRPDERESYMHLLGLKSRNTYEIDSIVTKTFSGDDYMQNLYAKDRKVAINKIGDSKNANLAQFYEKLFRYLVLRNAHSIVYRDSDRGLNYLLFARPITEDSTYFGSIEYAHHAEKYVFIINDSYFEEPSYEVTVPLSDTLYIKMIAIKNKEQYIDTTTYHQTIVKSNGKWRNINSL